MTTETTTVTIPYSLRREIAAYCSHTISPQRYYLHNAIGGVGWAVKYDPIRINSNTGGTWVLECSPHYATIVLLKYSSV